VSRIIVRVIEDPDVLISGRECQQFIDDVRALLDSLDFIAVAHDAQLPAIIARVREVVGEP
jgi:hypothetical protein